MKKSFFLIISINIFSIITTSEIYNFKFNLTPNYAPKFRYYNPISWFWHERKPQK